MLLRIILGQKGRLKEWNSIRGGVASSLVEVECLRTLDRLKIRKELRDEDITVRREAFFRLFEEVEVVEPTRAVLSRASLPFPVPLGTLDAIHLSTALLWRERGRGHGDLVMATHDVALSAASRACGLRVVGGC